MKTLLFSLFLITLTLSACDNSQPAEASQVIPREMNPTPNSPYFAAIHQGGGHETAFKDDLGNDDCKPPEKDCVVIRPTPKENPPALGWFDLEHPMYEFHQAVVTNTFPTYYFGATGNDFIILKPEFEDSVSVGLRTFYLLSDTTDTNLERLLYVFTDIQ
jgi:hypothetical protein